MAGGNLRESLNLLRSESGIALDSFIHLGLHISRGIEYLHAEGLAHRDIKSANILLTERLPPGSTRFSKHVRAKIADFGLSKYIDKATGGGTVMQSIMEPGKLEATYAYLAPESFGGDKSNAVRRGESDDEDDQRYDETAKKRDIYALGVLFWEMLTGQIPWSGVSLPDVYVRVCVRGDRPAPALDDISVSKSVRRLVERCWSQNPLKRPSARSIVAKLEKLAVKYGIAEDSSKAASAAVESVSVVSGQAPNGVLTGNTIPDMRSEPLRDAQDPRDANDHRAPSDSLISYQKMPSGSTVRTAHNEGSKTHSTGFEASDGRDLDDVPQFDDMVWADDTDVNGKRHAPGPPPHPSTHPTNVNSTDLVDNSPSSLNRRLFRPKHPVAKEGNEPVHSRSIPNITPNHQTAGASVVPPGSPSPSPIPNGGKTSAAVAATAAAIAAAKDRERKREFRGPATRATRPANPQQETSFPALPVANEVHVRNDTRARGENKAVFYDNSDEEAQDFDPEKAAAEEAIAESMQRLGSHSEPVRHPAAAARAVQAVRSQSGHRLARPKSPAVRRPVSPAPTKIPSRPFTPISNHVRKSVDEDVSGRAAPPPGPRALETSQKQKSSTGRGRLGRTLQSPNANMNRSVTPVVPPAQKPSSPSAPDQGHRRAFMRRMRSNDAAKQRLARSSSATGVENRRSRPPPKVSPSHISDTVPSEEDDADYVSAQGTSVQTKEDYQTTVNTLSKRGVLELLSQRMPPLRLAAVANAALQSPEHRNEEEVLRNACAVLHRLTVPGNSSQPKNNVQEISAREQLSIRKYLKSTQGVEALLQAMHPPQARQSTTLSYALLALGNLTAWDLEAHKHFRTAKGVSQITKVMKVHIKNNGVQEKGCYALACVGAAYPAKAKTIFHQSGALDVVIGALSGIQQENPNDAVTKQACAALGAMCSSSPPNAIYCARKDALSYLVQAFERFRRISRLDGVKRSEMRLVCKAFIDLLCHEENRKLAGMKGGSAMIIRAMRIFRLDADFVEKGLTTLSEFCTYRSNGTQIVQAHGIDDVVGAIERFPSSVAIQREGSRVLTLLMKATGDQARRRVVQAGGAEAIALALERFGGIPENHVGAVVETCRALYTLFLMENTAEGELLGRKMKKVKCEKAIKVALVTHKTNQQIQERGREALKQLGTLKTGGFRWGWMRSGSRNR